MDYGKLLKQQIESRFANVFDENSNSFTPAYTLAALFNPSEFLKVKIPLQELKCMVSRCVWNENGMDKVIMQLTSI